MLDGRAAREDRAVPAMTRTSALLGLLIVGLVVLSVAAPGHASSHGHWHGGVFVGVGPWWGPPFWGPYWWYPPPYYYPPVVIQEPQVYIERPVPPPPPVYWYYCRSAHAYYPSVQTCPEEWVKVPPQP